MNGDRINNYINKNTMIVITSKKKIWNCIN